MARSVSVNLRRRVVGAIEGDCRVDRRGSDLALARRGRSGGLKQQRENDIGPKLQGGDRHSQRIEAHAELVRWTVGFKNSAPPPQS
jgi:hypothetical protein